MSELNIKSIKFNRFIFLENLYQEILKIESILYKWSPLIFSIIIYQGSFRDDASFAL